jgi:hypothetical protein
MRETHWTVPLLLTCMRVPNCNARATVKTRIQPPRSCGSSPATNPRSGKGKDATAMGAKRNAHHRRRTQLPKRGVTAVAGYCGRKSDASEEAGPPGPTPSAAERGWTRKLQRCSSLAMKQSPDGEVTQTWHYLQKRYCLLIYRFLRVERRLRVDVMTFQGAVRLLGMVTSWACGRITWTATILCQESVDVMITKNTFPPTRFVLRYSLLPHVYTVVLGGVFSRVSKLYICARLKVSFTSVRQQTAGTESKLGHHNMLNRRRENFKVRREYARQSLFM